MKSKKDVFKPEDKVETVIIDRKTGKVKKIEGKNRWTRNASAYVIQAFKFGGVNKVSYINLYDTNGNFIKALAITWSDVTDTGTSFVFYATVSDNSTDTYTVAYYSMDTGQGVSLVSAMLTYTLPSPRTKGSTDVLNIKWTLTFPYS